MPSKIHVVGLVACLLFLTAAGAVLLFVKNGMSPALPFLGLAACGAFAFLAMRAPQVFLVAVIFAPQWKTLWPLSSIDRIVDLTLVMLACLVACLAWRLFAHLSRLDEWGMEQIFLGQSAPILAYVLFTAMVTVSYVYTTAPEYGATKLFRFIGIGSLLLIAPLFLIRSEEDFRRLTRLFVAVSGATVVQLVTGIETHSGEGDVTRIGAGWLVGMAIIIVLFYPLFRSESAQRVFMICSLPFFLAGLVASVARGPMLALSVLILFRLALWFNEGQRRTAIILFLIFIVSGAGAYYVLRNAGGYKYTVKAREMVRLLEGGTTSGSAATRLDFYRTTLGAIPDHPLLGQGVGSWSVMYYGRDERAYPHNLFLETAFEEGFLGLGMLLLLLGQVGASIMWLLRRTKFAYVVLGAMILYCVTIGMFSGDLDDNRILWFWIGTTLAVCRTVRMQQMSEIPLTRAIRVFAPKPRWLHPLASPVGDSKRS